MSTNSSGSSLRSCKCGVPSPVKVLWTKTNSGKQFVGCTNYKTIPCDSFEWIDPAMSPRSRIAQYYRKNNELKSKIEVLKKRVLTIDIVNAKNDKDIIQKKNQEMVEKIEEMKLNNERVKKIMVYWVFVLAFLLRFSLFVMKF